MKNVGCELGLNTFFENNMVGFNRYMLFSGLTDTDTPSDYNHHGNRAHTHAQKYLCINQNTFMLQS